MENLFDDQAEAQYLSYLKACDDGGVDSFDDIWCGGRVEKERLKSIIAMQEEIATWLRPFRSHDSTVARLETEGPSRIGKYEIEGLLGQGGMGLVYQARQAGFNRVVAIKTIRCTSIPGADDRSRFRNEVAAIAALKHTAIVPILDVGEHSDCLYYTMPVMENGGLDKHLQQMRDQPRQAVQIAKLIAEALQHAHQRGVLHRDIKPSNILLDREFQPFLSDFGLAKIIDRDDTDLTKTGVLVGTPHFMAPELLDFVANEDATAIGNQGRATATIASDIYALGSVLYTLLHGKVPFQGCASWDLPRLIREEEPTRLLDLKRGVDSVLEAICFKCLEKDPQARYSSAQSLADDLNAWSKGESTLAKPFTAAQRAVRWGKRHQTLVVMMSIGMLGVMVLLGGLSIAYTEVRSAHREMTRQRDFLRERIYAADYHEAFGALRRGDWESYRNSIASYRKAEDRSEYSGEEFDFLNRLESQVPELSYCYDAFRQPVFQAVFSPDGKWLAAGGADAEIHLLEVDSGKCLHIMHADPIGTKGHRMDVNWLRFTGKGERLISAGEDGSVRVWDPMTGTHERILFQGDHCIESFAIAGSSGDIVISDVGGMLRRVRFEDGLVLKEWASGIGSIECNQITLDGRYLIAGGHRNSGLICWDLDTYKSIWKLPIPVTCLSIVPDSKFCFAVDSGIRNHLIDISTGEVVDSSVEHADIPKAISVSPSGRYVASGGLDGHIRLALSDCFECDAFWRAHDDTVWSIDISADDRRLASCSSDGSVKIWQVAWQRSCDTLPLKLAHAMRWEPNGRRIALSIPEGDQERGMTSRIEIWDVDHRRKIEEYRLPLEVKRSWGWSHDGEHIVFSDENALWQLSRIDGEVRQQSQKEQPATTSMSRFAESNCLIIDHRGADVFRVDGKVNSFRSGSPVRVRSIQGNGWVLEANRLDEDRVAVLYEDRLRIWSTSGRNWVGNMLTIESSKPNCLAVSLKTECIAVGFASRAVRIYSMEDGQLLRQCSANGEKMVDLEFSPDGETLFGGGDKGSVLAWKTSTGQQLFLLDDSSFQSVYSLQFSSDGTTLGILGSPNPGASAVVCLKWKLGRELARP